MTIHLTIVRHGQTDFNVQNLIHSLTDGTINSQGVQQAKQLGRTLKDVSFSRIYSSDLQRCQDTTKNVLSELQTLTPEIVLDKRLRERDYSAWDGQPMDSIIKIARETNCNVRDVTAPGGESFEAAQVRVVSFLEDVLKLADEDKEENVLICSHGITIQYMLVYFGSHQDLFDLENFTFDRFNYASNTAVTRCTIGRTGSGQDGKRKITFHSIHDASHLTSA